LLPEVPKQGPAFLAEEINEAYAPELNGLFIRVTSADGTVVYLSGSPKNGGFDPARIPVFSAEKAFSKKILLPSRRKLLVTGLVFTNPDGTRFLVESGVPYQQVENFLRRLLLMLATYIPFLVLVAMACGYWLMRRSLQPIDEITQRAEGITFTNLSQRLPLIRTGDELERLSTALNRMIGRLEDAFQHANRFSADASHQLRTPIAGLRVALETELIHPRADRESVLQEALAAVERLEDTVDGLLRLARDVPDDRRALGARAGRAPGDAGGS